jgi:hypothetical protein
VTKDQSLNFGFWNADQNLLPYNFDPANSPGDEWYARSIAPEITNQMGLDAIYH